MFRVNIEYIEPDLTMEEVQEQTTRRYGDMASVTFSPTSDSVDSAIEFAIQKLITNKQLKALFDIKELYTVSRESLRAEAMSKLTARLEAVILENEAKL